MARRKKLDALVLAYHPVTGAQTDLGPVADVSHLEIYVAGLAWLEKIEVEFDSASGGIKVAVLQENRDRENFPRLLVEKDGSFTVKS